MTTHRFRITAVSLFVGVALVAAGCSSSSKSSSTTTTEATTTTTEATTESSSKSGTGFDCKKANLAAVKEVLGTLPPTERESAKGITACLWYDNVNNYAAVNLGTLGMFSRDYQPAKKNGTPVSGIGDQAYIANGSISGANFSASGKTLWVQKELLVYAISVDSTTTPNPTEAQLKAIAAPFVQ